MYSCVYLRCDVLVRAYVADTDPEARLQVGADMRKIQLCFQLLKVHCCVLRPCILGMGYGFFSFYNGLFMSK